MAEEKKARLLKEVKSMLRAVLISSKEGVPVRRIAGEYRALTGDPLPYNRLGYSSLEDLLAAIPDVVRTGFNKEGEKTLFAVADESTAHIQKMVKAQRSKKVRSYHPIKTIIRRPFFNNSSFQGGGAPRRPYPNRNGYPSFRGAPRGRYDLKSFSNNQPNYYIAKPLLDTYSRPSHGQSYSHLRAGAPFTRPRGGATGTSRPTPKYENLAVTISGKKPADIDHAYRGVDVVYSEESESWDDSDSVYPTEVKSKVASVVVRPVVMAQVKPREPQYPVPDEVRFGGNYVIPPRFRRLGRAGKENEHPAAASRDRKTSARRPVTPDMDTKPTPAIADGPLYIRCVEEYCRTKAVQGPEFDTMKLKHGYLSSVKIDEHTYGSLEPYVSKEAAEQAAAMNACNYLHVEEALSQIYLEYTEAMSACEDLHLWEDTSTGRNAERQDTNLLTFDHKVKERVIEISKGKPNGIWLTRLPFEYKEKYKENAPSNLEDLLKSWKDVVRLESNPLMNTHIVYPCKEKTLIPPAKLFPLGEKVAVYMSYLSKDGQFYVQHAHSDIENMSTDIQIFSDKAPKIPQVDIETSLFCVARYMEDSWCRAKILEWVHGSNQMLVLFVDYGNQENVSIDSIRKLNAKVAADPVQAVHCVLHGVAPKEGDAWSDDAVNLFVQLVQNNELTAYILEHKEDVCVVELYLPSDDQRSINECMVRRGVLKPTCPEYEALPDTNDLEDDDPSLETADTDSQQSEGSNEALSPGEPDALEFPEEEFWNVYVSFLTSTNDITVRLVGEHNSDKLEELEIELETIFKTTEFTDETEITEGMVCVVSVESLYHRVRVLEIRRKPVRSKIIKVAKCYYLDHGDTDEVCTEQLRPLAPQHNTLPYQAFHCGLAGLEQFPDNLMSLAAEKLFDLALGKTCVTEVLSRTGHHFSVILYDTSGDEDINVNETITQLSTDEVSKFLNPSDSPLPGTFDFSAPGDDRDSVTFEGSTTSSSGKPETVILKPKFLRLSCSSGNPSSCKGETETAVVSRDDIPKPETVQLKPKILKLQSPNLGDNSATTDGPWNDAESVSSESSSTSERSVTLKPKFLKSRTGRTGQDDNILQGNRISKATNSSTALQPSGNSTSSVSNSLTDAQILKSKTLGTAKFDVGEISNKLSDALCLNNAGSIGQEQTQSKGLDTDYSGLTVPYNYRLRHDQSTSSLGDQSSVHPEDVPLPDNFSDASSLSDADFSSQRTTSSSSFFTANTAPDLTGSSSSSSFYTLSGSEPTSASVSAGSSAISSPNTSVKTSDVLNQGDSAAVRARTTCNIWDSKEYLTLPLPPPYVAPAVGQYVDVHVLWVSDPENFVCLPYETLPKYSEFMEEMKQYFEVTPPERELTGEDIRVGHMYAGLQCGTWYRTVVKEHLQENDVVCISMVDIGEFDLMAVADLQPLPVQFWTLPFQAFRAKLNGVTLAQATHWSEASKYKFMELVLNKDLVGMVMGEDKESGVISLELIDTSHSNADVHINEIFSSKMISWMDQVDGNK